MSVAPKKICSASIYQPTDISRKHSAKPVLTYLFVYILCVQLAVHMQTIHPLHYTLKIIVVVYVSSLHPSSSSTYYIISSHLIIYYLSVPLFITVKNSVYTVHLVSFMFLSVMRMNNVLL